MRPIVELGKGEMLRWELIFFQGICIQKLLDLDMSDHMHWTEIYPKFSKICVLTQKDHLWPPAVPVNPKKTACFWCAMTKLYMFINLLQIILPSKSRLRDLHKTTTESSLWENYIFWEKVKIMVLMIFLRNLGKKEIWKIMSSGWKIPFF